MICPMVPFSVTLSEP